jgi:hypothetical protein
MSGRESERSLDNSQYHALDFEMAGLPDLDVRVLRIHRFEHYASFPMEEFFHHHAAVDRRDNRVPGTGLFGVVDQDQISILDSRCH